MWVQLTPQTLNMEPTVLDAKPNTALRLKNVFYDGEAIREIDTLFAVGSSSLTFNPPLSSTNLLLKTIYIPQLGGLLCVAQRGLYFVGSGGVTNIINLSSTGAANNDLVPLPSYNNILRFLWVSDTADSTKRVLLVYYNNGVWNTIPLGLPAPTTPPVLFGSSAVGIDTIEFRYCYTYYNSLLNIESSPSPVSGGFFVPDPTAIGGDVSVPKLWGLETSIPSGADKIRVYRFVETVGEYILLAELNATAGWSYTDNNPVDYLGKPMWRYNDMLPSITPSSAVFHLDRIYIASGDKVYISNVNSLAFTPALELGLDNPLLGGIVQTEEPIIKMVSIGATVLAFGSRKVYRIVEDNGVFFVVPTSLPTAYDRYSVHQLKDFLLVFGATNAYLITPQEEVVRLPINLREVFRGRLRSPIMVRLFETDKTYLDVLLYVVPEVGFGMEYLRINLKDFTVSGFHTLRPFVGGG